MLASLSRRLMRCLFPQRHKGQHELQYWLQRRSAEGELDNSHYVELYTTRFAISKDFYRGKRILDIGCGPRGSLEWAEMAAERVGLDPLAREYMKLGADRHQMNYVASGAEAMPFPKAYFDVVCSFNSLDHVANLDRTIGEIKRVTKAVAGLQRRSRLKKRGFPPPRPVIGDRHHIRVGLVKIDIVKH